MFVRDRRSAAAPREGAPSPGEAAPAAAAPRTDFDSSIAFLLTALANKLVMGGSRRLRRDFGVGVMEWRVLALLAVEGEATPARVAEVAGVDKSVVSRAVSALESQGLATVVADKPHARRTRVAMTPAGQALHDRAIVEVLEREARLLAGLDAAERDTMVDLLKRMTANLPGLDAEG